MSVKIGHAVSDERKTTGKTGAQIGGQTGKEVAFYEDGVFIKPEPVAEQSLESKIHALEAQLSALKKQIAK